MVGSVYDSAVEILGQAGEVSRITENYHSDRGSPLDMLSSALPKEALEEMVI